MKKGGKVGKFFWAGLIVTVALFWGLPHGAVAGNTIKVGLVEAKSGPFEYLGRTFNSGFLFAVDEQNAKGGLFGKKIEVLWEDSEYNGDVANRKAKKLLLEDKVDILVSGGSSAVAIALNKAATNYKTLYFNHGAMTDDIQGREFSRYGFRLVTSMYNIWSSMAQWMAKEPFRKFYVIAPDNIAGRDAARAYKEQMKIYIPDATVVGEDFHPLVTKDFAPYVTKIVAAKPDAIVLASYGPDLINFVKTARGMGIKAPILNHVVEPYAMNELKDAGVGLYITTQYSLRWNTPDNQNFIKAFHEMHKNEKDFLLWWPYANIGGITLGWRMTFAAMTKAGSLDPEKVIKTFEGFRYNTPVGEYTMRACDHQILTPMFGIIMEAQNPFFNGSIRPEVKFPFEGSKVEMFPAEKIALPATKEYNPRCP